MKRILAAALLASCASAPARVEAPAGTARIEAPAATAAPGPALPAAPAATPDADFRTSPPPPAPSAPFHAPVPRQLSLKNGLPVFLIARHEVPLVTVSLVVRAGADTDPAGKAGLANFTLDLLDEGTASRDAAAIARGFEDLGARYSTQADADATGVAVTALADTLDPVLELFSDVALHPAFREADVERVRVERFGQIAQALDDPQSVGQHVLSRVLYGEKHPWGFPAEGTVKSIKSLARKDLEAWHQTWFRPGNAALFVVGDTDPEALLPLLEKRFGGWTGKAAPRKPGPAGPKSSARTVYMVDKPDAPQSQIWIGELGIASSAPDLFPVRVMNDILGGSFNSRLNGNLRTEHAYSYGVFSFYDVHREGGSFIAAGAVVSEKTSEALGEFIKELERMKTGEVSRSELDDAKDSLVHGIPALFAGGEQTAAAYARAWAHGLPADYYATFQQRVLAVTADDVARAARERLHPERMAMVVVGPSAAISPRIAALKVGNIEVRDAEGEARKAAAAAGAGK
jgi:zinc protease